MINNNKLANYDAISNAFRFLNDESIHVVCQTAPSIRVALGEEFGMPIGTNVKGKMITGLRKLGFDRVFDTNTGADFTIMEEANEFVDRYRANNNLPMFTSCCPAWVMFMEKNYPDMVKHLSSCKSPHQMFGAIIKSYYANKYNIPKEKIKVISIMPCIAKKAEIKRPEMNVDGIRDVDLVISTTELADMMRQKDIDLEQLEDGDFDNPMGNATGAGAIFGVTGGVMEAALRTAADLLEGESLEKIQYKSVRGYNGIKKATIKIGKKKIKVAVVSGIQNARIIMDEIKNNRINVDFVEVMSCPGGCIMGSGQPFRCNNVWDYKTIQHLRAKGLYSIDEKSTYRKAHENPALIDVYKNLLQAPGSQIAEKYLHIDYKS